MMDDTPYREFVARPTDRYHRGYEALRALFLEGRSQKVVADDLGSRDGTLRHLVDEFRRQARDCADATPFFGTRTAADQPRRASRHRRG